MQSLEIFDSGLSLPPQIRAFFKFHFSVFHDQTDFVSDGWKSALPSDLTFNEFTNHYDVASFKRICNEFGISPSTNFRFTHEKNNGLGSVYIYATGADAMKTGASYPGVYNCSDEGGEGKLDLFH